MKTTFIFTVLAVALCIGFLVVRSQTQPTGKTSGKELTTNDDIALEEFLSLENYLNDTKQTNALKQLNDFLSNSRALQQGADLSLTVSILQGLRAGQTNNMLKFFEGRLDEQAASFGSAYRVLPVSLQKQMSLKSLQRARDYRTKFPFNNSDKYWENGVTNAFKILDEKESN